MNPNLPIYLYAAVFVALLGGAIDLVHSAVNPMSSSLFEFILTALGALLGHVLTMINPSRPSMPAASPGDKQAGRAIPFLLLILAAGAVLLMGGCGTLNAWNSAALTTGAADYTGMRQNIQKTDDMKLQGWIDAACAMNVGALQRAASTSGNGNAITAVFTACPVPGVGVTSNMPNGSLTVQTTTLHAPATAK